MSDVNQQDSKKYELGYLFVPFVGEGEKDGAIKKEIVAVIEKNGGQVISELAPVLRHLAYSIRKMINNKYNAFTDAYFGSIKFEIVPSGIENINSALRKSDSVIRHLLVEAPKVGQVKIKPLVPLASLVPAELTTKEVEVEVAKTTTDEVAIDKEIEDLLIA